MDRMGRKDHAREIAVAAGVPVVPAYTTRPDGVDFPVLVKAAAGGGGKGMRVVRSAASWRGASPLPKREAATPSATTPSDREVRRARPAHRGAGARRRTAPCSTSSSATAPPSAATRRCSRRRRPRHDAELRARLTAAAVALARQVGYINAGTVEFLLDTETGSPTSWR